ncbi:hypothetical protein LCGC14_2212650 [marine sediment metagenome]|uniref:Uncharacterized protein n=1 Tax=marine sediment metagenome TaxID=412755 RepID=A0A0F9FQU2_9ZZZZ
MAQKYTPGTWEARSRDFTDGTLIISSEDGELAVIRNGKDRTYDNNEHDVANARLMAASPALLESLQAMVAITLPYAFHVEVEDARVQARNAIDVAIR